MSRASQQKRRPIRDAFFVDKSIQGVTLTFEHYWTKKSGESVNYLVKPPGVVVRQLLDAAEAKRPDAIVAEPLNVAVEQVSSQEKDLRQLYTK